MNGAAPLSLWQFLQSAERRLRAAGIETPGPDARILTGHALELDRAALLSQRDRLLTAKEAAAAEALIARREAREPVWRIIGAREFYGLSFTLNEATLEPRADSETVVEAALERIDKEVCPSFLGRASSRRKPGSSDARPRVHESFCVADATQRDPGFRRDDAALLQEGRDNPCHREQACRILDLGTGTGCLLLALLHALPHATGLGLDLAPRAVEQARANAEALGLSSRATFRVNNWLDGVEERFDLVISNPPYIVRADIPGLMPEVREHDPALALDGGADGLDAYRVLIPQLPRVLNPGGIMAFEVGQGQADAVRSLCLRSGLTDVAVHSDLAGIPRCVTAAERQLL